MRPKGALLQTMKSSEVSQGPPALKHSTFWARVRTDWLPIWDFRDQVPMPARDGGTEGELLGQEG